jgi:general stress protein YciG
LLAFILSQFLSSNFVFLVEVNFLEVKREAARKMSRQEAGKKGGEKVARERGSEFYRQIGRKGGEKVAEERGSEFFREIGRKGGQSRGPRKVETRNKGSPNEDTKSPVNRPVEKLK